METSGYEGNTMNRYVTDTNGLIRYLADSAKLGNNARVLFDEADAGNCIILIPAMVLNGNNVFIGKKTNSNHTTGYY